MGKKIPSKMIEARLHVHNTLMQKFQLEGLSRDKASIKAMNEISKGKHNKAIKNCEKILSGRR
jgi:hypothetical protein